MANHFLSNLKHAKLYPGSEAVLLTSLKDDSQQLQSLPRLHLGKILAKAEASSCSTIILSVWSATVLVPHDDHYAVCDERFPGILRHDVWGKTPENSFEISTLKLSQKSEDFRFTPGVFQPSVQNYE